MDENIEDTNLCVLNLSLLLNSLPVFLHWIIFYFYYDPSPIPRFAALL